MNLRASLSMINRLINVIDIVHSTFIKVSIQIYFVTSTSLMCTDPLLKPRTFHFCQRIPYLNS